MTKTLIAAALFGMIASGVQAECPRALSVSFAESAPKDRFDIVNTATGAVLIRLRIDLEPSAGNLIFDTEVGGAGFEVFQPFESESGLNAVAVLDGATVLEVSVPELGAGARAGFTIDVDDRLAQSALGQTRVTGGEMQGARVVFVLASGEPVEAVFDAENRARACS